MTKEKYCGKAVGKIRVVEPKRVGVSLFIPDEGEIIGYFPRSSFRKGKLEVGMTFNYTCDKKGYSIELIEPRKLSEAEISGLEAEIKEQIPDDPYDR